MKQISKLGKVVLPGDTTRERLDTSEHLSDGMSFLPDERGVSEVLGSILVFALVLAVLVIIQVAGVPAANQQIEFEHNARVQADLQEFDGSVDRAAALGAESSSSVETGVRYPPRLFLINPGPTAGTVETSDPRTVEFRNVKSVNPETNDFFNDTRTYSTATLRYSPSYNEYSSAPNTNYEHGVLYNSDDDGGAAVFADGNLVSGKRITLTMLEGSLSDSSTKAVTLQTVPISGPSQTVSVQGAGGNDLELEVYTDLSEDVWRDRVLADEFTSVGGHVVSVECQSGAADDEPCNGQLLVTLESGVTYDLRLAKVGVGSGFTEEPAAYVTTVVDLDVAVTTVGGTVTAELRDRFNNPVPGETLYFYSPDGSFPNGDTDVSNEQGRVAAKFVPGTNVQQATIFVGMAQTASEEVDTTDPTQYVEYGVTVTDAPDPIDANQINPNDGTLVLTSVEQGAAPDTGLFTVTLENTAGSTQTVSELRLPFYYNAKPGISSGPLSATVSDGSTSANATVRGPYVDVPGNFTVASGDDLVLEIQFYEELTPAPGEEYNQANNDDFFVVSAIVSGTPQNYFVAPGDTSGSGGGDSELDSVSASSLSGTAPQSQTLSFTVDTELASGGTVAIDLSDADRTGNREITYSSPAVTSGGGTVALTGYTLDYVAPAGGLSSGTTVTITIDANPGNNAPGETYLVAFQRGDAAGSETTTFDVN